MDHRTNTLRISFFARTNKNKMLTCAVKELYIPGFAEGSMVDPRRGYFHFIVALVLPCHDGAWPLDQFYSSQSPYWEWRYFKLTECAAHSVVL